MELRKDNITGQEMRDLAALIAPKVKGLGFALIVFPFEAPSVGNYVSNGERKDMINALKEVVKRWENNEVFKTPE